MRAYDCLGWCTLNGQLPTRKSQVCPCVSHFNDPAGRWRAAETFPSRHCYETLRMPVVGSCLSRPVAQRQKLRTPVRPHSLSSLICMRKSPGAAHSLSRPPSQPEAAVRGMRLMHSRAVASAGSADTAHTHTLGVAGRRGRSSADAFTSDPTSPHLTLTHISLPSIHLTSRCGLVRL